jgi:hypothetical protein
MPEPMCLAAAQEIFHRRYYAWSQAEFAREIAAGFPVMTSFAEGDTPSVTALFMAALDADDRDRLASGLIKRFHQRTAQDLGLSITAAERALIDRRDEQCARKSSRAEADQRARRRAGTAVRRADQRRYRTILRSLLPQAFPGAEILREEAGVVEVKTRCAGWILSTMFSFGGRTTEFGYLHGFFSDDAIRVGAGGLPMTLANMISFNAALGICSTTDWSGMPYERAEAVCTIALALAHRFIAAAPQLLEGIPRDQVATEATHYPGP